MYWCSFNSDALFTGWTPHRGQFYNSLPPWFVQPQVALLLNRSLRPLEIRTTKALIWQHQLMTLYHHSLPLMRYRWNNFFIILYILVFYYVICHLIMLTSGNFPLWYKQNSTHVGFVYNLFKMSSLRESALKGIGYYGLFLRFLDCRKTSIHFIFHPYILIGYRIWKWDIEHPHFQILYPINLFSYLIHLNYMCICCFIVLSVHVYT